MIRSATVIPISLAMFAMCTTASAEDAPKKSDKLLRHVVLFKFKDDATKEQVKEIVDAFRGLPKKIDAIADFEYGTDVSVEGRAQGFTHCFVVSFRDEKARDTYLPHAAHQDFVKVAIPKIDKVLVFDFWSAK